MHDCSLHPTSNPKPSALHPVCVQRVWTELKLSSGMFEKLSLILAGIRLAPVINKPSVTTTPASPSPASPSFFSCRSLTNPSFQEREAELFWGHARGAVLVGTTSRCHSKETIESKRQAGELSTPRFPA